MAQQYLPLKIIADIERLRHDVSIGAKAAPEVYLSLPLNDGRNTVLVVPFDYYLVNNNRGASLRFVRELSDFKLESIPSERRLEEFEHRYHSRWKTRSPEEWGLMLIFWFDIYRDELDPQLRLSDNLARWLKIPLSWWQPFKDKAWYSKLIGSQLSIKLDARWVAIMTYESTVRLDTLNAAAEIGGPTLIRMALVVLGSLPPARLGWVAVVAFQSVFGLLDFLFTIWEAERDEIITEEESKEVGWAACGIAGFDLLQFALMGVRLSLALPEFLSALARGAKQLAEELPDRVAAAQAGYNDYVSTSYADSGVADNVFVLLDD